MNAAEPHAPRGRRVAILQSNYVPWKGYFDLIAQVDHFVLYDEVQFTKNDWRNRNLIKTPQGTQWLTVPVRHSFGQRIDEVVTDQGPWRRKHWAAIEQNYSSAPCFGQLSERIRSLYDRREERLSAINRSFIEELCAIAGIRTPITWSIEHPGGEGERVDRLVAICRELGADTYVSGPAARVYLEAEGEERFRRAGIALEYFDYPAYWEYPQLHPPFEHKVSMLDVVLNLGSAAQDAFATVDSARVGSA